MPKEPKMFSNIAKIFIAIFLLIGTLIVFDDIIRNDLRKKHVAYWPTIKEMQEFAGAKVDGIWGAETDRLYRKAQERWYCDNAYTELLEKQKGD